MNKSRGLVLLGVSLLIAAGLYMYGGQVRANQSKPSLTALDYIEIQQLYSHYAHYLDTGDGQRYAEQFTPDGVFTTNLPQFGTFRGRKELAALAVRVGSPRPLVRFNHFTGTVMIDPSPEGATGSAYLLGTGRGQGYVYDDTFVKTAEGWRFKTRTLHQETPAKP